MIFMDDDSEMKKTPTQPVDENDGNDVIREDVKKTSSATHSGFAVKRHWPGCQSDSPGEMNQVSRPHLVVVRYPLSISEI